MRDQKLWLNPCLALGILLQALPLSAQTAKSAAARPVNAALSAGAASPVETFRGFYRSAGDGVFPRLLEMMIGTEAGDAGDALEAQAVNFYESFAGATKDRLSKVERKAKEISEKRYAQMKEGGPATAPPTRGASRRGGPRVDGDDSFASGPDSAGAENDYAGGYAAPASPAEDGPGIQTTETDSSVSATATDSKTVELASANITRTADASSNANFDGKAMTVGMEQTERIEAVSKTSGQRIDKTDKTGWSASFGVCPDRDGVVRGRGKVTIYTQTTSHTGGDIAALTREASVEFDITAYVNDDAVFEHFDMKGESAETLTGYDRARRRGLVQPEEGWSDGTRRITYDVSDNKPPQEVAGEHSGETKIIDAAFGRVRAATPDALTDAQVKRIGEAGEIGLKMIGDDLKPLMLSLTARLANGECVDVECAAPKSELQPGESVEVTTVSRSKQDLSKFNARIEAVGDGITPPKQSGTPTALFTFTAPPGGGGDFVVKSVSRRGIGLGVIQFAKAEKEETCDGNWHGTVEIRKTFERAEKETTRPGDVSSNLQMSGYKETVNRSTYRGEIKVVAPKLDNASGSPLGATYGASGERYYLSHNFWMEPGDCGWYRKTTTKVDGGIEETEKTSGEGETDVTVQILGGGYRVSAGIPEISGTYIRRAWNHPTGYCQEKNNLPTDDRSDGKTTFDRQAVSVEGVIDPRQPDLLAGTKTVRSDDGREETVITWRLKRCAPAKPKPVTKRK